jgi:nudix-type nucleoside diphosphatase (YffH/AdpP family)
MIELFLCGPWARVPLLERLGMDAGRDGRLTDMRLVASEGAIFPFYTKQHGDEISGRIVYADDEALARLRFLSEVLDWHLTPCRVEGHSVQALLPPEVEGGELWRADDWAMAWEDIAILAVEELLEHRGRLSSAELRGRMHMVYSRASARMAADRGVPARLRSATTIDTVECLKCETSHAGFFLTRSYELRHPGFDGAMSPRVRREVFVATDAAILLPYDPGRDRVLLVEQFRMGPYGRGDVRPWMLEPVAGRVDAGEDPVETARRECLEEAGVRLHGVEHISSHYCTPGCSTEYFHLFLGLCDLPDMEKGLGGLDSEDEDIRTHVISYDDAMQLLQTGEADNGPLVLSLLWLQRERTRLRASA